MNKKAIIKFSIVAAAIIAIFVLMSSLYTVQTNETALLIRLGKIQAAQKNTGLHMHTPFIENVTTVYCGDRLYDIPVSDVITSDKKSMIADNYVIWSVDDATKYYQTLGAIRGRAEERIGAAVFNATKNIISSMTQDEIIAARGNSLTERITKESNSDISQYGIVIELAEIKALDLPDDNKEAVYERMISERNNIAASYTAQGDAEAQKIHNETDKQVAIIKAQAEKSAAVLEAEGEAAYMETLSKAYDTEDKAAFYSYIRGLDTLKNSLKGDDKTIILDKNSELARILYGNFN